MTISIGGDGWFKQLEEMTSFNCYYGAHIMEKADGSERTIGVSIIDSKATDSRNIKVSQAEPTLGMVFNYKRIALIKVFKAVTALDYYNEVKSLAAAWGVEVDDRGVPEKYQ